MINDTFVAIDLETTGLSPDNSRILEIGAWKVEEGRVTDTYETFVQCPYPISEQVSKLTGITDEMVKEGLKEEVAIRQVLEFCQGYLLLGHNIRFDYSFLKAAACRYHLTFEAKTIDTLGIARKALPDIEKRSLEYLCHYYKIVTDTSHRALEDARAAFELYKILEHQFGEHEEWFMPKQINFKPAKKEPVTRAQMSFLSDLLAYHHLELEVPIRSLTKSEASRRIDTIIRDYGRIERFR